MAARRQTRESAEATLKEALAKGQWAYQLLKALPAGVDPALAAEAALSGVSSRPWFMANTCRKLPVPVIREAVARLPDKPGPWATFLRILVDGDLGDEALAARWRYALEVVLSLGTSYAWGSKQRKAKIRGLAEDAEVLAAVQATAASSPVVPLDMLAVLAFDGSEASVDALVPHVGRAADSRDTRLDRLEKLKVHARPTPAVTAMLESVSAMLAERNAASPALELPPVIGLGTLDLFWFSAWFGSVELNRSHVPVLQGSVTVDSREVTWFNVWLTRVEPLPSTRSVGTSFSNEEVRRDDLALGSCAPADLPAWLKRSAKTLGFTFDPARMRPRTHLRGAKRDRLHAWLTGG